MNSRSGEKESTRRLAPSKSKPTPLSYVNPILYRFDTLMMMNTENSNLCNSYSVVRPMVRDNSSPQQMRKRGFYMVDSTYTVPCNPNSMRDAGPLRNAEYIIIDPIEEEIMRKSQQSFRQTGAFSQISVNPRQMAKMRQTMDSRCTHLRPLSSFGGNPANLNGTNNSNFFSQISGGSRYAAEPNIIPKVTVVRVADYTKNISSSIFSPNITAES